MFWEAPQKKRNPWGGALLTERTPFDEQVLQTRGPGGAPIERCADRTVQTQKICAMHVNHSNPQNKNSCIQKQFSDAQFLFENMFRDIVRLRRWQERQKEVWPNWQGDFLCVWRGYSVYFKGIFCVFEGDILCVSRGFSVCFKGILCRFQENFLCVSRGFSVCFAVNMICISERDIEKGPKYAWTAIQSFLYISFSFMFSYCLSGMEKVRM